MMTPEDNELLTRVGPGTKMGELLRRYWHPIAASDEMTSRPTKAVRILGETLVLFRDALGNFGLIGDRCPHRRASLLFGMPDGDGLRCAYHGWRFDRAGQCTDMPGEPPRAAEKRRVSIASYPVEELGGLIFAYLGPEPAPRLPSGNCSQSRACRGISSRSMCRAIGCRSWRTPLTGCTLNGCTFAFTTSRSRRADRSRARTPVERSHRSGSRILMRRRSTASPSARLFDDPTG